MPPKSVRPTAKATNKDKVKKKCEFCEEKFSPQGLPNHHVKCATSLLEEARKTIASLKDEMKELRAQLRKSREATEAAKTEKETKSKPTEELLASLSQTVSRIEANMKQQNTERTKDIAEREQNRKRITQLEAHSHRIQMAGRAQMPAFQPPVRAWGPQSQRHVAGRIPLTPVRKTFPQQPQTEVTIAGIPYNATQESKDNLVQAVLTIAKAKGVMMSAEDIESAFRATRKKGSEGKNEMREQKDPPRVVVRFGSNKLKNDFKRKKSDDPPLIVGLISEAIATGGTDENTPLYINENLSPEQRSLFWKARNLRKRSPQGCFPHCWTKDGQVCLRDYRDQLWNIRDEHDLESPRLDEVVSGFER